MRRNSALSPEDVEDLTQTAFLALSTALRTYDFERPLSRFVCLVTERVVVDEYRRRSAAKRKCEAESLEVFGPRAGRSDSRRSRTGAARHEDAECAGVCNRA